MSKADYIPKSDNDLIVWLDHFIANLSQNPGDYGLSQDDMGDLKACIENFHNKIDEVAVAAAAAKRATANKKAARKAVVDLARTLSKRIKAKAEYTEGKGADLGISGPETSTDLATSKPMLMGEDQTDGRVIIKYPKKTSHGVNLYGQYPGATHWDLLGRSTVSPFIDKRPLLVPGQPELRRYTAVYMLKDEEIGQWSDVLEITCAP